MEYLEAQIQWPFLKSTFYSFCRAGVSRLQHESKIFPANPFFVNRISWEHSSAHSFTHRHAPAAELRSCNRPYGYKAQNIYYLVLYRTSLLPPAAWSRLSKLACT